MFYLLKMTTLFPWHALYATGIADYLSPPAPLPRPATFFFILEFLLSLHLECTTNHVFDDVRFLLLHLYLLP